MGNKWAVKIRHRVHAQAESLGNLCVESFHFLALFAIGAITAWASVVAFLGMVEKGNVTVDDILLLFIYLELGAMTGIYFKTKGYVTNISSSSDPMLASPDNAGAWCA
ncbi:Phosphate-starvation-inducible E [Pseudomonas syringae pv. maculicola]|nr:Phosphate-starvation-inducible E [Pseudomonas syringae pv. maculicola]